MRKKHYTRQRVQQQRKAKRRYPFDENTMLCELFRPEYFKRLDELTNQLRPYLSNDVKTLRREKGLFLSTEGIKNVKRTWLYALIALTIAPGEQGESPLKVAKSIFFRYLSSSEHSNITLSEPALKASVNKALGKDN
nr:hypothetical protein [uncultured Prevotella sp.]